jgi:hypothetical protein
MNDYTSPARAVGPLIKGAGERAGKAEDAVADQNKQDSEKSDMRMMWIMTAAVVVFILAIMGINMWTHPDWMHGG